MGGKGVPVVGFFENITEAVATKVVGIAGSTLEEVDSSLIGPKLVDLDLQFLNPLVEKIVGYLMGGASNMNEMITYVGKPLGLIEDEAKKTPTTSIEPEVTSRNAGVF